MGDQCVVVHSGARDHYQLAQALSSSYQLYKLVTDIYCPDALKRFFPSLAITRSAPMLSSKQVTISTSALWYEMRMKLAGNFAFNHQKDQALGTCAASLAKKKQLHLFSYSYYAADAFALPRAFGSQKKILFQLHPHPLTIRRLLERELQKVPVAANSILYENEFRYNDAYLRQLGGEPDMADAIAVASHYTAKTLTENGVPENKITVIPYGISTDKFVKKTGRTQRRGIKAIFIGSMVQRKGLSYLLEAMHLLDDKSIELVICGRGFSDEKLLEKFTHPQITIKKDLSHGNLLQEMHNSDVFVFPTLCEGFAHVILEAMASGLPVITTDRCCGPDIIEEGKQGFIIPANNSIVIADKLQWAASNKNALYQMGQAAAGRAEEFTWQSFRDKINLFYKTVIKADV